MIIDKVRPDELAEYLQNQLEDMDMDLKDIYNGHFDIELFASIGESYANRSRLYYMEKE